MRTEQPDDDQREDQHVDDEQSRDDRGPRVAAPEQEEGDIGADQRDRQHDREQDPDPGARDQVVGQRVTDEPVGQRQDEQRHADRPVELARLAEGPREEHPGHVDRDSAEEDVGPPVVHLAHEQAGPDREAEVDRRRVGLRHPRAPQRQVRAVIDERRRRRHVIEAEEDPRHHQHDEGVEGDLAQHEGPVIREDLVEEGPAGLGDAQAVVELVDDLADPPVGAPGRLGLALGLREGDRAHERSQKPGPIGWSNPDWARRNPDESM